MENIIQKTLKELDPEALEHVSGGKRRDEGEMYYHVVYQCLRCQQADAGCKALLDSLIEQFKDENVTQLDIVCPKGLLDL